MEQVKSLFDGKKSKEVKKEQNEISYNEVERIRKKFGRENFPPEKAYYSRASEIENKLKDKEIQKTQPMGKTIKEGTPKRAEYTPEERKALWECRESIEHPKPSTIIQKAVGVDTGNIEKDLGGYLCPKTMEGRLKDHADSYGFIAKAEDVASITKTPQECHDNLRLDFPKSDDCVNQYDDPNQPVYLIRFTDGENYKIPYDEKFNALCIESGKEIIYPSEHNEQPFAGNGYTAAKDYVIPEYKVVSDHNKNGAIITDGGIFKIYPDKTEELVAYYHKKRHRFILVEQEGD